VAEEDVVVESVGHGLPLDDATRAMVAHHAHRLGLWDVPPSAGGKAGFRVLRTRKS
jgi:hypothetical protein